MLAVLINYFPIEILNDAVMQKNDDCVLGIEITTDFRRVSPKAVEFFFYNRIILISTNKGLHYVTATNPRDP